MKIGSLHTHKYADLFPMLKEAELEKLAESIKEKGQLQPIILYEGKVLDGRNRLAACVKAGVSPDVESWENIPVAQRISPLEYVVAINRDRRHLDKSQAAQLAADYKRLLEDEYKQRQRAGLKKGKEKAPVSALMRSREDEPVEPAKAAEVAAKAFGVSARYVEDAARLQKADAELAQKVRTGEMKLTKALSTVKKRELIEKAKVLLPPQGAYHAIVWDPAWPYPDQLDGGDDTRGGLPYQEQSLQEICDYPLPAAADCVLFLWITNHHLLEGSHVGVLKAQGFKAKYIITWCKTGAPGLGNALRNNTEHFIIATRGHPPMPGTMIPTYFVAPKREHSRKPEEFWPIAEELCPYPAHARIEINARQKRDGWVCHGAEVDKFEPVKAPSGTRELRPMKELERECKVRGFSLILDEQSTPPEVIITCNECGHIFNSALIGDNRAPVPVELLEEMREHTCEQQAPAPAQAQTQVQVPTAMPVARHPNGSIDLGELDGPVVCPECGMNPLVQAHQTGCSKPPAVYEATKVTAPDAMPAQVEWTGFAQVADAATLSAGEKIPCPACKAPAGKPCWEDGGLHLARISTAQRQKKKPKKKPAA